MSIHIEKIPAPAGQSFRLLRWRDNVKDIEEYDAVGGTHPVEGAGEHWHLHREMELTFVESGRGLRLVGDNIARFSGPEIVLLGSQLPHCWHGLKRSTGFSVQFHWPAEHPLRVLPEFAALGRLWPRAGRGLLFSASVCDELRGRFEAIDALAARLVEPTDAVWRDQEEDRVACAVTLVLTHPGLDAADAVGWLDRVRALFVSGEPGPVPPHVSNTMRALRSLHVALGEQVLHDDRPLVVPHAGQVRDAVTGVLGVVTPWFWRPAPRTGDAST